MQLMAKKTDGFLRAGMPSVMRQLLRKYDCINHVDDTV